jgi:hypothetical protein
MPIDEHQRCQNARRGGIRPARSATLRCDPRASSVGRELLERLRSGNLRKSGTVSALVCAERVPTRAIVVLEARARGIRRQLTAVRLRDTLPGVRHDEPPDCSTPKSHERRARELRTYFSRRSELAATSRGTPASSRGTVWRFEVRPAEPASTRPLTAACSLYCCRYESERQLPLISARSSASCVMSQPSTMGHPIS